MTTKKKISFQSCFLPLAQTDQLSLFSHAGSEEENCIHWPTLQKYKLCQTRMFALITLSVLHLCIGHVRVTPVIPGVLFPPPSIVQQAADDCSGARACDGVWRDDALVLVISDLNTRHCAGSVGLVTPLPGQAGIISLPDFLMLVGKLGLCCPGCSTGFSLPTKSGNKDSFYA